MTTRMNRMLLGLLAMATLALSAGDAVAQEVKGDQILLADLSWRGGTIIAIDAADLQLQKSPGEKTEMIPLAEVREIRWANGRTQEFPIVQDPYENVDLSAKSLRSSTLFRKDDLELSRGEVLNNAWGRGLIAGTLFTLFGDDASSKKWAFLTGFSLQFGLSFYMGW